MRNHNHLLDVVAGCDGLKTGYFSAAGFSIVATARLNDRRLVAVVAGCRDPKTRDKTARRLLTELATPMRGRRDQISKPTQHIGG
jgi:D-alanyl-D-alanine carboxypeptidase (penicillin-binding protein 5/6)